MAPVVGLGNAVDGAPRDTIAVGHGARYVIGGGVPEKSYVAVTFDFWNTLIAEQPGQIRALRLDAWERVLAREGIPSPRSTLEAALDAAWQTFDAAWQANRQYRSSDAAALVLRKAGADVGPAVRDELIELFVTIGATADLPTAPNVGAALSELRRAGLRIGIICDVGMTPSTILRSHLEKHGLLGYFDHWSFSDEVGVFKPDRRIFEHALAGLGHPDPTRTAHVGDLRRTDVAGARSMGMVAIRYCGVNDDPAGAGLPEGDHVVADHADLAGVLR